jgi:ComF family protein
MPFSGRPAYLIYQWFLAWLDWVYPPYCGGCGLRGTRWCSSCQENTQVISPPVCQNCGQNQRYAGTCERCRESPPHYLALRSWAAFNGPLRKAIHRLKYKRDITLGETLAQPMIESLGRLDWKIDVVIPVPLGVARQAERGYNQAALLARPIAWNFDWEYEPKSLSRTRETRTQVGLNLEQRRDNVTDAFQASSVSVSGKRVLVVDDVTTSGATMDACASALLKASAKEVYGITLARAVFDHRG